MRREPCLILRRTHPTPAREAFCQCAAIPLTQSGPRSAFAVSQAAVISASRSVTEVLRPIISKSTLTRSAPDMLATIPPNPTITSRRTRTLAPGPKCRRRLSSSLITPSGPSRSGTAPVVPVFAKAAYTSHSFAFSGHDIRPDKPRGALAGDQPAVTSATRSKTVANGARGIAAALPNARALGLTRSLTDFAKLVELFDRHHVVFRIGHPAV